MFEGSNSFMMLTLLILALILAVFAMKYTAHMMTARAEAAKANEADSRLASLEKNAHALDHRVAHLEAMLKEVE